VKLIKAAVMFMCFVFLVAGLAISSKADARNEKVFFTFSGPVEIPGSPPCLKRNSLQEFAKLPARLMLKFTLPLPASADEKVICAGYSK